jgi:hypothetical protein
MTDTAKKKTDDTDLDWEVEAALAWHDEDARATIATLLLDCNIFANNSPLLSSS